MTNEQQPPADSDAEKKKPEKAAEPQSSDRSVPPNISVEDMRKFSLEQRSDQGNQAKTGSLHDSSVTIKTLVKTEAAALLAAR